MSEAAVTFPALALASVSEEAGRPPCERLTWFVNAADFSTSATGRLTKIIFGMALPLVRVPTLDDDIRVSYKKQL